MVRAGEEQGKDSLWQSWWCKSWAIARVTSQGTTPHSWAAKRGEPWPLQSQQEVSGGKEQAGQRGSHHAHQAGWTHHTPGAGWTVSLRKIILWLRAQTLKSAVNQAALFQHCTYLSYFFPSRNCFVMINELWRSPFESSALSELQRKQNPEEFQLKVSWQMQPFLLYLWLCSQWTY